MKTFWIDGSLVLKPENKAERDSLSIIGEDAGCKESSGTEVSIPEGEINLGGEALFEFVSSYHQAGPSRFSGESDDK